MKRAVVYAGSLFLLCASLLTAQTGRGVITGQVTDSRSAVIPAVAVVVTSEETGVRIELMTNDTGLYSALNLAPGKYSVTFNKPGMRPYERQGVVVFVNQTVRLDVAMEVGAVTESITVMGNVSPLNTETTDIGTGVEHRIILDLPLTIDGGRQLESFAYAITPAVEGNAWTSYVNGGPAFSKEVLLDGTSQVVQIGGDIEANSPSVEAVDQFKIETSGMPAEYGRTGGGVFLFAMKSGANQFHGSGLAFFRNEVLNANTWNNNFLASANPQDANNYRRQKDRQWTYAGSIGGPIIKNKTFFYGAFERFKRTDYAVGSLSSTVPTPGFLSGDFSALLNTSAAPLGADKAGNAIYPGAIFDPQTGNVFPGNVIPSNRISTVSQRIVDIYRSNYQPMLDRVINNNALPSSQQPDMHAEQFSLKLDHNITDRHKLSGSYIINSQPRLLIDGGVWDRTSLTGGPFAQSRWQDAHTSSWRASYTFLVSPSVMNVLNGTYGMYFNGNTSSAAGGNWVEKLGLGAGAGNFPYIGFGDAVNGIGTTSIGSTSAEHYVANNYILNDVLSWVKGRHTFKFGFDLRFMQMNSHSPAGPVQSYEFTNRQTGAPMAEYKDQVGFGFASFLLGAVGRASQGVPVDLYGRRKYFATFAQDDFKVNTRLTLNLGLRWEMTTPLTEKYGHWANFDYNLTNTQLGAPGALAFAGNGSTSFMKHRDWSEFGPRIGAAYRVNDRIVARAAYGVLYLPLGLSFWKGVPYGFAPGFQGTNQVNENTDFSPAFNWDQGYQGTLIPGTEDPNQVLYPMVRIDPNALKAGRLHQWNAGVEFQVTRNTVLGANYVGMKGTRLQSDQFERNQPDAQAFTRLLKSGNEWSWVSDQASADAAGVPYPYPGFSNYAYAALAPYPQVSAVPLIVIGVPKGTTSFKALEVTLARTGARGLNTNLSYTLSRARGNVGNAFEENWWNGTIQDVTKLGEEARALQAYDVMHVLKGYVSYDLPFGHGQPFLPGASRVLNAMVAGWSLAGLFNYQSGMPLRVGSNNNYAGWAYYSAVYPNVDPNANFSRKFHADKFNAANSGDPGNRYFDGQGFSNPAYGEFGTGPLYSTKLRGFGRKDESVSILKNFWIRERFRLQFRAEFTNIFNRHYFNNPDADINSPTFGQVQTVSGDKPREGQLGIRVDW